MTMNAEMVRRLWLFAVIVLTLLLKQR